MSFPSIEELIAQLGARERAARAGGGPERVQKQHEVGKLTARERMARLFDPDTFSDTATFEDPCRYPVGLAAVTVGGRLVVHGDRMTGERPGRFCRRGGR